MNLPRRIEEYNKKHAAGFPLVSSGLGGIEQAVVIPAISEREFLFATLAGLARNPACELRRTLIICVINNRKPHIAPPRVVKDNQDTLRYLNALVENAPLPEDGPPAGTLREISRSSLRVAYIDASSPGREMPDKWGGVGAARKIGMDAALKIFDYEKSGERPIISLDADTLVEENYLEVIRRFFNAGKTTAVVNYTHQRPKEAGGMLAITAYEIFLRYYVLGLAYAGSPYAFHSIGSTMICTADAYAAVGGMNKRDAAEDFYFLNKLAKYGEVGRITGTTVHPSARVSWRVPFGTGQRMARFAEGKEDGFLLYDPRVFAVLKKWLDEIKVIVDSEPAKIMVSAGKIHPMLPSFLEQNNFPTAWRRIRENVKGSEGLLRHFHFWFDGFKTLKLIHFLTDGGFPQMDMFRALEGYFSETGGRRS